MSSSQAQASFTPSFTGRNASKPYSDSGIYDQDRVSSEDGVVVLADGHGMRGRDCAEFLAGHIREEMTRRLSFKSPTKSPTENVDPAVLEKSLVGLFHEANEALRRHFRDAFCAVMDDNGVPRAYKGGATISGGAVVTAIVCGTYEQRHFLTVANVGDAEAYVYSRKSDGTIESLKCTTDHGPDSRTEQLRLKTSPVQCMFTTTQSDFYLPINDADGNPIDYAFAEGKALYYALLAVHATEDPAKKEECVQQWREANKAFKAHPRHKDYEKLMWTTKEMMANRDCPSSYLVGDCSASEYGQVTRLQTARALGDFAQQQVGVIPTPDTTTIWLDQLAPAEKRVIFVASDGVHDCFTKQELAELVLSEKTDDELIDIFVQQSKRLFGGRQHDDISFSRSAVAPSALPTPAH